MANSELLRFYARGLRQLTGASALSLWVPGAADDRHGATLIHEGEGRPLPELASLDEAEALARRAVREGHEADPLVVSSKDPQGQLIRLPAAPTAWALLLDRRPAASAAWRAPERRAARRPTHHCWLGLRLAAETTGSRLLLGSSETSSWLLELGGRLAAFAAPLRRALLDPVTGLPGRLGLDALLQQELHQARRAGRPLALLLVNPDDFAQVNERYGDRQGDRVLAELGGLLLAHLRASDGVSRFGAAIFAAVLPDTPPERARQVGERLVAALEGHRFLEGELTLRLRAGVAAATAAELPRRPLDLVRRANEALRLAKQPGSVPVVVLAAGESDDSTPGALLSTGDLARDYRNTALLRDAVRITASGAEAEKVVAEVFERLFSALRPEELALFEPRRDGEPQALWALRRGPGRDRRRVREIDLPPEAERLVRSALQTGRLGQAAWGEGGEGGAGRLGWVLPVAHSRRVSGALFIAGAAESLDVGPEDLVFLEALASQLAIALERGRPQARQGRRRAGGASTLRRQVLELQRAVDAGVLLHRSPAMAQLVAQAERLAATDAAILITGERGTGKSLLARYLHDHSPRRERSLTALDCRSAPEGRAEEELFGPLVAGPPSPGLLAEADRGTLYLADLPCLPPAAQERLLAFLRHPHWAVAGLSEPRRLDIRLLASSGPDPEGEVAAGRLRADLLGRIGLHRLSLPSLRDRPEDIELLAEHFLATLGPQYGKPGLELAPRARRALLQHSWSGNVRELRNRVLQAVLLATGSSVEAELLGLEAAGSARPAARRPPPPTLDRGLKELRGELRHQLVAAGRRSAILPLGRWLGDDLLLEIDERVEGVARRGALAAGLPETTYRRRLAKARSHVAAGLAPRTADWHRLRESLQRLVRAPDATGTALLDLGEGVLLAEILRLYPADIDRGAALLGVTAPTFRRRLARLSRREDARTRR